MPDTLAAKPRPKVRFYNIPVEVPAYATEQEVAEFEMRALYRAYRAAARRVGAEPRPAVVVQPRAAAYPSPVPAGPPSPVSARTVPEFLDAMRALKKWARVSYEKLEQLGGKDADGAARLPHSTMNRLLSKSNETKLPDNSQLAAFVLACGLTEEQWREWSWVHGDIQSTGEGPVRFPTLLDRFHNRGYGAPSAYSTDLAVRDLATVEPPMWSWTSNPTVSNATLGAAPTMRVVVGPAYRG